MTNGEKERIIELQKQGYTHYEIGKLVGYSTTTVSVFLRKQGVSSIKNRGNRTCCEIIKNPKIRKFYEVNNYSVRQFAKLIHSSYDKATALLEDEREVTLSLSQIKTLLKAMDMTFEEVFGK